MPQSAPPEDSQIEDSLGRAFDTWMNDFNSTLTRAESHMANISSPPSSHLSSLRCELTTFLAQNPPPPTSAASPDFFEQTISPDQTSKLYPVARAIILQLFVSHIPHWHPRWSKSRAAWTFGVDTARTRNLINQKLFAHWQEKMENNPKELRKEIERLERQYRDLRHKWEREVSSGKMVERETKVWLVHAHPGHTADEKASIHAMNIEDRMPHVMKDAYTAHPVETDGSLPTTRRHQDTSVKLSLWKAFEVFTWRPRRTDEGGEKGQGSIHQ